MTAAARADDLATATVPAWPRSMLRVVAVEVLAYRRTWRGSLFSSFVEPLLYLLAIGVGLGTLVDRGAGEATLEDLDYVRFLAPALLVATGLRTAASESTWPVMAGIKWRGTYSAALATPVRVLDLVTGLMTWNVLRALMNATAFGLVAAALGAVPIAAVPALVVVAVAVAVATSAPLLAYTAAVRDAPALSNLFRYGVVPAFLFSGTFFPLDQLPDWTIVVAWFIPLWHGVELGRTVALDAPSTWPAVGHVIALAAWVMGGATLARLSFRRRLTP